MNPANNLFLIGPMGAGKSTVGRKLAAFFGLQFIDLDREIERSTGASVNLIFEIEGEQAFRVREARLLDALSRRSGVLLATGGGAILLSENRDRLRSRGFVVYLKTDIDVQLDRLKRDRARPLLQCADPRVRLEALARARNALYEQCADYSHISTSGSARSAAGNVSQALAEIWQRPVKAAPSESSERAEFPLAHLQPQAQLNG
jgi:shikimate kinase